MKTTSKNFSAFLPIPHLLHNHIQHYAWGETGEEAYIPKLLGIVPGNDRPYAELWIGAHPKSASELEVNNKRISLFDLVKEYPKEVLGEHCAEKFSQKFPFLLKVVSVAEALSIQAHPNQQQAVSLHRADPEHYPDDIYKPEIVIALESFKALIGFKNITQIKNVFKKYPEILSIARLNQSATRGKGNYRNREGIKSLLTSLLLNSASSPDRVTEEIFNLGKRLRGQPQLDEEEEIFLKLQRKYPQDMGLFFIFLLNLVKLEKGQGIYIKPGTPHAYLEGNVMECMASSDNVVRLGLTSKYKSSKDLLDIVAYEFGPVHFAVEEICDGEMIYKTPAEEFQVSYCIIHPGTVKKVLKRNSPEVLFLTKGRISLHWEENGQIQSAEFRQGQAVLTPAYLAEYSMSGVESSEVFRVTVPQ